MSIKPKVDIDVLLYMFQEYEKGKENSSSTSCILSNTFKKS
ncbi:hypothetical protein [Staphylococcus aureus]|nr:hypothetical protein [Staphylococcus aureus]